MVREFGVLDTNGQTFPPMSSDAHYLPREGGGSSAIHTRRQTHKEAAVSTKTLEKHYMDQGPTIIN